MFQHLDQNHDGVITPNEIPDNAPPPLKALLKAADKKGDKKITKDEFLAAAKEHHEKMLRERPAKCPMAERGPKPPRMAGPPGERKPFDLKALFASMDTDKDGKLGFDEFSAGMKQLHEKFQKVHERMVERFRHEAEWEGHRDWYRRAGPPPCWRHDCGCPCCEREDWHHRYHHRGDWGGDHHGDHHEHHGDALKSLEAKVKELDAKVKALEAKK